MKITQIAPYVNEAYKETVGENAVVTDDLSNIVDMGTTIANADLSDKITRGLMNQVGRMVYVERKYDGIAPSVLMDGSEFGSVLAKISATIPEAQEDQAWSRVDGGVYPPVFYATEAQTKLYNSTNPYEFRISTYRDQLEQSFRSPAEMERFISMRMTNLQNAATIALDNTIRATINNFIAETLHSEFADGTYEGKTGVRAINVLYLYNQSKGTNLTKDKCLYDPEFIRYAIYVKNVVQDRLHGMNNLYNLGGQTRFTAPDRMHTILLGQFADAAAVYLYDGVGQFRTDNIGFGTIEKVPYWQGIGKSFGSDLAFDETSKIAVKTSNNNTVTADGILGVIFDRDALGVFNKKEKVTTDYSGAADFWTSYYKYRAQYFNDFNEQFVVLFVA